MLDWKAKHQLTGKATDLRTPGQKSRGLQKHRGRRGAPRQSTCKKSVTVSDGPPPTDPGGNTLVILDTCVLLPSCLSDVLFDLMLEGLYFVYWTGDVEAEFLRNWPLVHPDASKSGAKRLKAFQRAANNWYLITG